MSTYGKAGYIWHAYNALDESRRGEQIKSGQLKVLTHNLASCMGFTDVVVSMDKYFEITALGGLITFEEYLTFLKKQLFSQLQRPALDGGGQGEPRESGLDKMKNVCWMVCAKGYLERSTVVLSDDSIFQLWLVYNQLAEVDENEETVCPVTVDWEEIDLILEKIHKLVGTEYNRNQFVNEVALTNQTLSFSQLLDLLEERQHLANVDTVIANGAILELYEENILEVLKKGYLSKKGPPIMPWKERWCILTPTELKYFTNGDLRELKGQISISDKCSTEALPDRTGTKPNRFQLKVESREFEFSTPDLRSKMEWIAALRSALELQSSSTSKSKQIRDAIKQRRIVRLARRAKISEEERYKLEEARKLKETQERLEAEKLANSDLETRMKDLEEMQRHLEMHLEKEIKAREAEADSRLKQEKAFQEESEKRKELEVMQAALENLLKNEEAKREELEEIQKQQEELLRREKEMLIVLENARRLRDEEYHEAILKLKEAEQAKEEIQRQLEKKRIWSPPPRLDNSPLPILGTHRGKGFLCTSP